MKLIIRPRIQGEDKYCEKNVKPIKEESIGLFYRSLCENLKVGLEKTGEGEILP